jgi:hypothetical protein
LFAQILFGQIALMAGDARGLAIVTVRDRGDKSATMRKPVPIIFAILRGRLASNGSAPELGAGPQRQMGTGMTRRKKPEVQNLAPAAPVPEWARPVTIRGFQKTDGPTVAVGVSRGEAL